MIPIFEFLLGKANHKHIIDFPDIKNIDAIVKFLEENEFENIESPDYESFETYVRMLKIDHPFYIFEKDTGNYYAVIFSNGGSFTKKNPLFIVSTYDKTYKWIEAGHIRSKSYEDFELKDFRKKIMDHFGWQ